MPKQKIQLILPANLNYSSLVRHVADEVFSTAKFDKAWCSRLKLVVDELYMNAVRYGSTPDKSSVCTTFEYDESGIQFTIEDDGTGVNAISAEDLKAIIEKNEANSDLTRTSGRGLAMITKLWTDGVIIGKSRYGGISVGFTKALSTAGEAPPPPPAPTGLIAKVAAQAAPVPAAPPAKTPPPSPPTPKGPSYEIKLSGEIDQSNIDEKVAPIYDQIEVMPEEGTLVLDFSDLEYINSTFIGNLASWYTTLQRKGGRICLKNVNKDIREVLSLVGLLEILECPVS
ncbi:ATP-binding protein [Candidatus Peregrinibacteria bacterium]|nr:ATP-binding protein [Candidatus Peregrinibacteria bacterium]